MEVQPYFPWLEESLSTLVEHNPSSIGLVAECDDDIMMTAYYNGNVKNKFAMLEALLTDIVMDIVTTNVGLIREALEEEDSTDYEEELEF